MAVNGPQTLFDKIWQAHLVEEQDDGTCLLYIDRHLVHEVTSPQAFEGLRAAGRRVPARGDARRGRPHRRPTRTAKGIKDDRAHQVEGP